MENKPKHGESPLLPGFKPIDAPPKPPTGEEIMRRIFENTRRTNPQTEETQETISEIQQLLSPLFEKKPFSFFNFGKRDETADKEEEVRGGSMNDSPLTSDITPLTNNDEYGPAIIQLKNSSRLYFAPKTSGIQKLFQIRECYNYNPNKFQPGTPIPEKYKVTIEKIQKIISGTSIADIFPENYNV